MNIAQPLSETQERNQDPAAPSKEPRGAMPGLDKEQTTPSLKGFHLKFEQGVELSDTQKERLKKAGCEWDPRHYRRVCLAAKESAVRAALKELGLDSRCSLIEFSDPEFGKPKKERRLAWKHEATTNRRIREPDPEASQILGRKMENLERSMAAHDAESSTGSVEAVINELNKKHAFIHTDSSYILTEKPHAFFPGVGDFVLESRQSLLQAYENQIMKGDSGKPTTKAKIWLAHPERRSFPNGITFDPTTTEHTNGFYNLWGGFSRQPKKGCFDLFKKHIREVICAGNSAYFEYVWKWCASIFQHPDRIHTALLLMGLQGTGKGVFVKALGKLFGKHFVHLDNLERLVGNFNCHMKHSVLIFADEAVWGGNRKDVGKLKSMITEELAMIEPKGKDTIAVRNFRHFIFASNEDWPVHLDPDDRRFFVLKVSDDHKEDFSYFEAVQEELENGGYEALLHALLHEDLSGFNPRDMPINLDAFHVKMRSASSTEQYLFEALKAGCFDIGNRSPNIEWKSEMRTDSVYADYLAWAALEGLTPRTSKCLGESISKLTPSVQKSRSRKHAEDDKQSRPYIYSFPSQEKARGEFENRFKASDLIWK